VDRQDELNKLACGRDGVLKADGCSECEENLEYAYIRLLTENSVLKGVYAAAKHHYDVRLPVEPGFDEAVIAADRFYESIVSSSPPEAK